MTGGGGGRRTHMEPPIYQGPQAHWVGIDIPKTTHKQGKSPIKVTEVGKGKKEVRRNENA